MDNEIKSNTVGIAGILKLIIEKKKTIDYGVIDE